MELKTYLHERQLLVNKALRQLLPSAGSFRGTIHQAMRYSVLGQGKRIRPILTLAACEAVGGKVKTALPAACALELIHAYSLIHDDLPAMDDDDLRRGKPSCHKRFGEAVAVLSGDALLTFSFELLSKANHDPSIHLKVIQEVTKAIGTQGMIGGQVVDIRLNNASLTPKALEYINTRKTGALIAASIRVGGLLGGVDSEQYRALSLYGERIGLVFQLVDDLLDKDGAVRLYGEEVVRQKARRLTRSAIATLSPLGKRGQRLKELALFILTRES